MIKAVLAVKVLVLEEKMESGIKGSSNDRLHHCHSQEKLRETAVWLGYSHDLGK